MTISTMRRALVVVPVLAGLALAGCSSGGSSSSTSSASSGASLGPVSGFGADNQVAVNGAFGKEPSVTIPAARSGDKLVVKTLINGTGAAVSSTSASVANLALYDWRGTAHSKLGSTYTSTPQLLASASLLPGLAQALNGQKAGSRVLAVIPPALGYGPSGNAQGGVKGTDTLVFIVDVIGTLPANASIPAGKQTQAGAGLPTVSDTTTSQPAITIPKGNPPSTLTAKVLIQGTGPVVQSGQYIVVQYTGVTWRTGQVFDSSYLHHQPFGVAIGVPNTIIVGWDLGLVGKKVGSRVLLTIPPKDGYGPSGNPQGGIKGTDTLVFAVDILAAY